jgi:GTP cyclohydrolase I
MTIARETIGDNGTSTGQSPLIGKTKEGDREEFRRAVAQQLRIMEELGAGEDLRPGLERTPERVTKMWLDELTAGYAVDIESLFQRTFDDHEDYSGMVLVKDIPVMSQCEHHLVPFVGYTHIAYFPSDRVLGLSKLPRVVDAFARRLQLQERLTQQIHDALVRYLKPRGVIVVVECEHLCMTLRGIQKPGTKTMTSAVSGLFRDPEEYARQEFFNLIANGR